jgi:hypothetical protein
MMLRLKRGSIDVAQDPTYSWKAWGFSIGPDAGHGYRKLYLTLQGFRHYVIIGLGRGDDYDPMPREDDRL